MVIFAQIFSKQALKDTIFFNFQKRPKNGQMAKSFYFWQTVSKKAKFDLFGLFKGQMATLVLISIFSSVARGWAMGHLHPPSQNCYTLDRMEYLNFICKSIILR